jgi:CheY-like chemotaxis protein
MTAPPLVLIVDDDDDVRDIAVAAVGALGYRTIAAADGPGALAQLEGAPDLAAMLTDIRLNGAFDGIELAKRARQARADLKVLYMTGHGEDVFERHRRRPAADELLNKPYRIRELEEKLARLTGWRPGA